jgi:Kelch motif
VKKGKKQQLSIEDRLIHNGHWKYFMPGTWTPISNAPQFEASTMLLLTDGTVMCQQSGGVSWYKLTPHSAGDYSKGTWRTLAPMHNTRLYYASAVLRDGRVLVCGGEYSNDGVADGTSIENDTNKCELYDPVADVWTVIPPPAGWTNIGDAACCILPDGKLLLGYYDGTKTAIFDPATNSWAAGPAKSDSASEETWTLLPDNTVLTVECSNVPYAEKYVAASNLWVSAGKLPVTLVETTSIEIGPALLLPNGKAFCIGATGKTAIYSPPAIASQTGTWVTGPPFPNVNGAVIGAKDAPAALLPNGKVLFTGGPVDGLKDSYLVPTYFFEYDGGGVARVAEPGNAAQAPYTGRLLLLPTGQVLFTSGTRDIYSYTPDGTPNDSWRPTIANFPNLVRPGASYTLQGSQLNGLSQAVSYGDDVACATNYPLVKIRHLASNQVTYCRTFDHSTMGVATGSKIESTNFEVPLHIAVGDSELVVVANGISSHPVALIVQSGINRTGDFGLVAKLIGSLADGPLWVLGPNGPVPVDGSSPVLVKEAETARAAWVKATTRLKKLGDKVVVERQRAAEAVPPAHDLAAEAGGSGKAGSKA